MDRNKDIIQIINKTNLALEKIKNSKISEFLASLIKVKIEKVQIVSNQTQVKNCMKRYMQMHLKSR